MENRRSADGYLAVITASTLACLVFPISIRLFRTVVWAPLGITANSGWVSNGAGITTATASLIIAGEVAIATGVYLDPTHFGVKAVVDLKWYDSSYINAGIIATLTAGCASILRELHHDAYMSVKADGFHVDRHFPFSSTLGDRRDYRHSTFTGSLAESVENVINRVATILSAASSGNSPSLDDFSPREFSLLLSLLFWTLVGGRPWQPLPADLLRLGPFYRTGIPTPRGVIAGPTKSMREKLARIANRRGCHSCGTGLHGNHFIADHQPPSALVRSHIKRSWRWLGWLGGGVVRSPQRDALLRKRFAYNGSSAGGGKRSSLLRSVVFSPLTSAVEKLQASASPLLRLWAPPQRLVPHCAQCSLEQSQLCAKLTSRALSTGTVPSLVDKGALWRSWRVSTLRMHDLYLPVPMMYTMGLADDHGPNAGAGFAH